MEAIVLHLNKYNDRANIVHLYTSDTGMQSALVYGLNNKQGKATKAILEPFTHIDAILTSKPNVSIQTLTNASILTIPTQTRNDMRRRAIAIFLAELIYRTQKHPMQDQTLFTLFIKHIQLLETSSQPQNLHIQFMLEYANSLGIGSEYFVKISSQIADSCITRIERENILKELLNYYQEHLTDFVLPKSVDVLTTIFD